MENEKLDVEESAIQEKVVEKVVEPVLARDEASDDIAKRYREKRNLETTEKFEDEEDDKLEEEEEVINLKVDGEIVQKTQAEIDSMGGVAETQKSLTADRRLQQIAEERQKIELERSELQLAQQQLQKHQTSLAKQNKAPDVSNVDIDKAYVDYADAVYSGDTEQLIAATKKLQSINVRQETKIDTTAEIDAAVKRTINETNRNTSINLGKKAFADQYSNIANNPELYNFANQKTITIMNANPTWTPEEIIMEAGKQTQEWIDSIAGTNHVDSTLEQRNEQKRKKVSLSSAKAKKLADDGYKPKTQEEIFADFKKSRAR